MAGAGYKLFTTGSVLTAADVNTYLAEQTVMVFANAAARTTALSGVVSEGMISYLKDTNAVEVYDGSNWVSSDDPNAIQNTIVDAKGDLIAASAADTPARLAVGNNGETLVADSSTSTGLRWQGDYAAGKNKIINGDFNIWQRGTSFSNVAIGAYTSDRWIVTNAESTGASVSRSAFTVGTAPVTGYESQYFLTFAKGGTTADKMALSQRIEDVRIFANQTVTISYWMKASTTLTNEPLVLQNFGSGGSSEVYTTTTTHSVTTSWTRYSVTVAIPSISGKTIGTSSFLQIYPLRYTGSSNVTIDIWGVQVEAGNVATAFQTATGTLAGEFAAATRYFYRAVNGADNTTERLAVGQATTTSTAEFIVRFPNSMRVAPTLTVSAAGHFDMLTAGGGVTAALTAFTGSTTTTRSALLLATAGNATLVAGNATQLRATGTASTIDFSAEL